MNETGLTRKIFGVARSMKKTRSHKPRYRHLPPPKRDSDNSDWNENLYPQNYKAKVQSQVSPRCPLPSWPKGIRKDIPSEKKISQTGCLKATKP